MAELVSIKRNVDVSPGQAAPAVFHCSQGDVGSKIILGLLNNGTAYSIPPGVTVTIEGSESNGSIFTPISATASGSDITFYLTGEMTAVAGPAICQAVLKSGSNILGTANFTLEVESSPMGADAPPVFTDAGWTWMLNKLNTEFVPALGDNIIDAIDSKADQSDLTALSNTVVGHTGSITVLNNTVNNLNQSVTENRQNIATKLDKNQGTANAGKYLKVAADGNVETAGLDVTTDKTLSIADKAADAKAVGDELTDLKADLSGADLYDLRRDLNYYSENKNGIVFTWDKAQSKCTITGTATAVTFNDLFMSTSSLPANIKAGDVLRVKYKASNVWLIFYDYSGGNLKNIKEVKRDCIVKIPDTCTGLIIRLWIGKGTAVNETVAPEIYKNANCLIESVDTATEDESGKTDMRSIIQEMLDIYGYCKLGPGAFYVSDVVFIPEHGTLEGCGESTQIYLMSGNFKATIMLRSYGAVRNLSVIGSYTDLTESDFGSSAGSRYGIQYYKGSSNPWIPAYSSISNVFIKNFTAAGIYQYGTGANVEQGLFVSNVHIKNCWCGIWIYSNSEFCRYENVQMTHCYIDCINNGGNNAFNNCVFHAYSIGMKIDGTQNNSAHGMCANSSFCHTGNNTGSALTLDSIANGFVFSSCQFWYNSIDISGCGGIVFSGCEFGRGTTSKGATINISNGNTVMFGNCVFMNDVTYPPDITITNNTKVKFNGCYGSVSGNEITA